VPYEHYRQGLSRVTDYFAALYREFGIYVRHSEILRKCGYKKEADEIDARVAEQLGKKLNALIELDLKSKKLPSTGALMVAREAARGMWNGYALGYKDSFTVMSDLFRARDYEWLCKTTLQKAREWSGEPVK